jgi:hypothetical protein
MSFLLVVDAKLVIKGVVNTVTVTVGRRRILKAVGGAIGKIKNDGHKREKKLF